MREDAEAPRYEVAISLRLCHSEPRDLGQLLQSWGLAVGRAWQAGDQRVTPKGGRLEGNWPESYAYANLSLSDNSTLSAELWNILGRLEEAKADIVAFDDDGGEAELFVHWHFVANSGDMFDWKLLSALASYRLNLALDIYPDHDWSEDAGEPAMEAVRGG